MSELLLDPAGRDDNTADHGTGFVIIPPASAPPVYPVAHEFFHVIQFGMWGREQGWLNESTAEWAGQNVVVAGGGQAPPNWYPSPGVSLDCMGASCADRDSSGYRGSIFMEYLDERFGMGIVGEAFQRAAALGAGNSDQHSLQALGDAVAGHGTSFGDVFADYAIAAVAGGINRPGVTGKTPATQASLVTGDITRAYAPVTLPIDHLAFSAFAFFGNDSDSDPATCQAMTLDLAVDLPAGIPAKPAFVVETGGIPSKVIPLAVSGTTARITVPWSDCSASSGTLVLANGGTSLDDQPFAVHITVLRPTPPPLPSNRFSTKLKASKTGALSLTVTTRAAGRLSAKATTLDRKRKRTVTYATRSLKVRRAGSTAVKITPTSTAKKLLKRDHKLKLTIRIIFTPTGGKSATSKKTITIRWRLAASSR